MEAGDTLDRVRSAIAGQLDPGTLTGEERRDYYSLLDDVMANPSPDEVSAIDLPPAGPSIIMRALRVDS